LKKGSENNQLLPTEAIQEEEPMSDLSIKYAGLNLENPIIAGASGLTANLKTIEKLQEAGIGAIVCKSLFEEEIQLESLKFQKDIHKYDDLNPEMLTTFPDLEYGGPKEHLFWLKKTKEESSVPVIGSLNAVNYDIWLDYSRRIEDTGVDAIELNLYRTPDHETHNAEEIENNHLENIALIKENLKIPVTVKLSPFYTNVPGFIKKADQAGIEGVVLFNRLFAPDIDIQKEEHSFPLTFSNSEDNLFTQKYTGLLYGQIKADICSSQGIMNGEDLIKMLLAGASSIQVVSTLYKNKLSRIQEMKETLKNWMNEKKYASIKDFRGKLSQEELGEKNHWLYKRTQYIKMLMQSSQSLADQIF